MAENEKAVLNVWMPVHLRERARVHASRLGTTASQLVRDALLEKVEALEAKQRAEEEARKARKAEPDQPRGIRPLLPLGQRKPLPTYFTPPPPSTAEQMIKEGAYHVFHAGDSVPVSLLRTATLIERIKLHCPLTCPDDDRLQAMIEREVLRLRSTAVWKMNHWEFTPDPAEGAAHEASPGSAPDRTPTTKTESEAGDANR